MKAKYFAVAGIVLIAASAVILYHYGRPVWVPAYRELMGRRTVEDVMRRFGPEAEERMAPFFYRAGVP